MKCCSVSSTLLDKVYSQELILWTKDTVGLMTELFSDRYCCVPLVFDMFGAVCMGCNLECRGFCWQYICSWECMPALTSQPWVGRCRQTWCWEILFRRRAGTRPQYGYLKIWRFLWWQVTLSKWDEFIFSRNVSLNNHVNMKILDNK